MLNYFKSRHFRMSYFIYFFVLGVLIFVFCSVFLYRVQRERKDEEEREIKAQTELMVQILDEKFNMIDQMALQISQSAWKPYVSSKSDILYSRVDYFKQKEICQQIDTLNILLQISNSTAVFFANKNLAVDGYGFWEKEEYLKRLGFSEEYGKMLLEKINCNNISMELIVGEKCDSEKFVVVKRFAADRKVNDLLFIVVDNKYFKKFLSTSVAAAVCFELYYDGEAIFSSVQDRPETELTVIRMSSSLYPWEYVFHIRKGDSTNLFSEPLYIVLVYLGLTIVVLFLSYLLSRLTYHPIVRMAKRLDSKNSAEFYGLEYLEQMLQNQQIDKEHMEELGNRYYHMGLSNFLNSLLSGVYEKDNVGEYAKGFHTDFKESMVYLVTIFVMDEDRVSSSFLDIMLKFQMMSLYNKTAVVMCNIDGGYAMIMGTEDGEEILAHQWEKLNTYMDEYLPEHEITLYAGNMYAGFRGIYYSCSEAQEKLRKSTLLGKENYYYYPFDEEMRMINQLRNGNFCEVQNIFCKLERENRVRELLPEIERKLMSVILENLERFIVEVEMVVDLDKRGYLQLYEEGDIPGMWKYLREQVERIEVEYMKNKPYQSLGWNLVKYVNENFVRSELTQQGIADNFGISRPTVSKIFKETTNMNFVDYLHRQRVAHAKILMQAGNYNVMDVARKSGYENEVTFKRAFMKHEGVSPREYVKYCRKIT